MSQLLRQIHHHRMGVYRQTEVKEAEEQHGRHRQGSTRRIVTRS